MGKNSSIQFGLLLLLVFALFRNATAQESSSLDWNLASLRGIWEYHTYESRWTLEFESDSVCVYNGEEMEYELVPGGMLVRNDDGEAEWKYDLADRKLAITFPAGDQLTLRRIRSGDLEERLNGRFYTTQDSVANSYTYWSDEWISFDGEQHFATAFRTSQDTTERISQETGLYRIEGNTIILAYDDGTIGEAWIRYSNMDDEVDGIIVNDRLFMKEFRPGGRPILLTYDPTVIIEFPPPPLPPPPPPPPEPPAPHVPPSPPITDPPTKKPDSDRTFGPTRGDYTPDDNKVSQRDGRRTR